MRSARPEMRAVDLVEVDELDVASAPWDGFESRGAGDPDGEGQTSGRQRRRRAGRPSDRRWGAAAVVAVALLVGGGSAVSERRESVRLEAVAELPGVLHPIDAPLTEVWRSDRRMWSPLWDVAGLLVGVSDVWDGVRDVAAVALDAATGEVRWSTTVVPATTSPIGGVRCVVPDAPAGGTDADRVVVCLSIDELGPSPQDLSVMEPRKARLLVLAVDTGEVLEERAVDSSTSVAALGPDLVVREVTDEGRVQVTRTGPRGRDVRWTFTGPRPTAPPEYTFVRSDDGRVIVPGEAGWVLTGDGDVEHAWEADRPAASGWADIQQGRVLVQPRRDLVGSTRVVDLRSGRAFDTDGYPLTPTVDDGSTGDLVLLQSARGDGLVAHEIGSGDPRWTVDGEDAGGVLVLDGRVVRAVDDFLHAVDARTGATLWSSPAVRTRQYGLHTDGRVVLRAERQPELGVVLVARGLDDGRVRWTSDVTDDLEHLVEADGRLYGLTQNGIVALAAEPPAGA